MLKIVVAYPIVLFSGLTEPHLVEKESHEAMFGAVRGLKVNKILNYGVGKARPKALLEKSSPNAQWKTCMGFPGTSGLRAPRFPPMAASDILSAHRVLLPTRCPPEMGAQKCLWSACRRREP